MANIKTLAVSLLLLLSVTSSFAEGSTEQIIITNNNTEEVTTTERPDYLDCVGECPLVDPLETSIYLVHLNCEKFCQCSNGSPIVLECPANLQFNRVLNVCDYPDSANCTGIGGILQEPVLPPIIALLNK